MNRNMIRKGMLLLGDWGALYLSLFILTLVRYGADWQSSWDLHLKPFSLIFPLWIIAIYGNYLYETRFFRPGLDALRATGNAIFISLVASISAFYLFPPGLIHPRRNLVIFALIYFGTVLGWRTLFYRALRKQVETRVLFLGGGNEVEELKTFFKDNPHLRYRSIKVVENIPKKLQNIVDIVKAQNVSLVVVKSPKKTYFFKSLFALLATGVTTIELEDFYERTLSKVSPEIIDDIWFIRNLEDINLGAYELSKRVVDLLIGAIGTLLFVILYIPIGTLIKTGSRGPVIFKQERVGKDGSIFNMYKFRSMKALTKEGSAEIKGPKWTSRNDARVTPIGNVLRKTRLDELPQFWNILKGDMSMVGPRPERPEFIKSLKEQIPYYDMRHLVKPGLTGWAQINYKYGDSTKDALVKLQYDIYYAKKRSLALDLAIIVKTIKIVLTRQGR